MAYSAMIDTDVKIFEKRCYELYQLDWIASHGYSLSNVLEMLREAAVDMAIEGTLDSDMNVAFDEMVYSYEDKGFNGELYACFNEFIKCEFKDELYMKYLLDSESFGFWKSYN